MSDDQIVKAQLGDDHVPAMAIGTWAWGDKRQWGYEESKDFPLIRDVWKKCNETGLTFYDTAEVYGMGESENIIGKLLKEDTDKEMREKIYIASKVLPAPVPNLHFYLFNPPAEQALRATNKRLGIDCLDLFQIHSYPFLGSVAAWAKALADCQKKGLCKAIGVSNFSQKEMVHFDELLQSHGTRLVSNQIEFNLLRQIPVKNGMLEECKKRNIAVLAYSPLAMGRLTGKYSTSNKVPSNRRFGSKYSAEDIEPLIEAMRPLADKYSVSISAIALNWVICKGAIPLGGARNPDQAAQNASAITFRLTEEEVEKLSSLGFEGEAGGWWQHG